MDLDQRYAALCQELGHLDGEILIRKKRRKELRAEMRVLKRLAVAIHKEPAHAPTRFNSPPNGTPTAAAANVHDAGSERPAAW